MEASFEFCIVASGGRRSTRIFPTVQVRRGESIHLVRATVSFEEWVGPVRAFNEDKALRELEKVGTPRPRPAQRAEDLVGEWRSFNRLATLVDKKPEDEAFQCAAANDDAETTTHVNTKHIVFECEEVVESVQKVSEGEDRGSHVVQYACLPGDVTVGECSADIRFIHGLLY